MFCLSVYSQTGAIQLLGENVNSAYSELGPVISVDGKTLYFTRSGHPRNVAFRANPGAQDVWFCLRDSAGNWTPAQHPGPPFNTQLYNSIECVSADGKTLYLRGAYVNGIVTGPGFSKCERSKFGWGKPQQIKIEGYAEMMKGTYTSFFMCPDNQTILLSFSDKKKGKNDLWISFLGDGNKWSRPVRLPFPINQPKFTESTPFMAPDNRTLYFSSNRPGGLGLHDIYISHRIGDGWEEWTEPLNMGPEVNTSGWDGYYTLDAKGTYAYLVTNNTSLTLGKEDIIRIALKPEVQPEPVVLLSGMTLDSLKKSPVPASTYFMKTDQSLKLAEYHSLDGAYTYTSAGNTALVLVTEAPGYFPKSILINLPKLDSTISLSQDILLQPIKKGEEFRLDNLYFASGQSEILPGSFPSLKQLADWLLLNPGIIIEIQGHTDDVGEAADNLALSNARALAVKNFLIQKGCDPDQIKTKGFGESLPSLPNDNEENRQRNRRVMVMVLQTAK